MEETIIPDDLKQPTLMTVIRTAQGMSQTYLAYHCRTHQPMISVYESGKEIPTNEIAESIAKVLNWSGDPRELFAPYQNQPLPSKKPVCD